MLFTHPSINWKRSIVSSGCSCRTKIIHISVALVICFISVALWVLKLICTQSRIPEKQLVFSTCMHACRNGEMATCECDTVAEQQYTYLHTYPFYQQCHKHSHSLWIHSDKHCLYVTQVYHLLSMCERWHCSGTWMHTVYILGSLCMEAVTV